MKNRTILFLIISLLSGLAVHAQTQAELTEASRKQLKKAELELKTVYDQIVKDYKADNEFLRALEDSQAMWEKFRQAELKMMYPQREPFYYGSSHQMCINDYLTELTNDRIKKLSRWLTGEEEGNVCAGSVKWKEAESDRDK